jgi:hypothetical protein
MNLKEFKSQIKSINQLNKKLENFITFYEDRCYKNYEKAYNQNFDFYLSKIELNDIILDIKSSYINLENNIIMDITIHKKENENAKK